VQTATQTAPLLSAQTLYEIEQLVDDNLKYDWILRVEHSEEVSPVRTQWQQWGKALFAVEDTRSLISNLLACRTDYPTHTIRLHAEKLRPQTQFTYWVYRPQDDVVANQSSAESSLVTDSTSGWLISLNRHTIATRNSTWRIITVMGVLLASLLAIEESIA
jgi:ribulose-bisphosphate carboxylase small chain